MHYVVGRLGLFLYGFLFGFEAFFRWFIILILHWFNHEELTLLTVMFAAPCLGYGFEDFLVEARVIAIVLPSTSAPCKMRSPHQNEELMESYNPTLASTRVHVLNHYPRKASCLYYIFHLLRRLPSCGLDTSLSFTQVAPLLDLH
ncbi:hypothetical protein B296_00003210 [Ensete ventricosum]|uniref:Uncharacterized protein n=1 Tax=Ensete ventricosum TaxID=4639 RepID=A0A426Z8Z0_ENSVE|nr:hypothetical protein B296_00003210 [Ensete ventricosum]